MARTADQGGTVDDPKPDDRDSPSAATILDRDPVDSDLQTDPSGGTPDSVSDTDAPATTGGPTSPMRIFVPGAPGAPGSGPPASTGSPDLDAMFGIKTPGPDVYSGLASIAQRKAEESERIDRGFFETIKRDREHMARA